MPVNNLTKIKAYPKPALSVNMLFISVRYLFCFFSFLLLLTDSECIAQEEPDFDEISVRLEVPQLGGGDIDAVIKNEKIWLPVTDLFDFLKIRNIPSQDLNMITGFFINQDNPYSIDRNKNIVRLGTQVHELEPGALIRTEFNLYLKGDYFGKIFGLECNFSFRDLTVNITSKLELPVLREMRQEQMRKNLNRLKGETKADTNISRSYPLFHFGMADYSVIAQEQVNGPAEARLHLSLGSIIAGGEATASINYNSASPFREKNQHYLWRYVNNENKAFRQIMAGKIATRATSTIYNPVLGVQVTNTPTKFRRSFGSYTLSDRTEPGWIVELYVNNVLVNFVQADASGFFTFEVPLVYGNSLIRLKYYGPWGEEKTREQNINIPFNFIPKKSFEYNVSAGMVEDTLFSRFSRGSFNYGLSNHVTIGAGYEYLSSVTSGPMMPYINTSVRLAPNLLISGEYTHSVRAKGTLTYRLPSNIQFDLDYIKYDKDQTAINYNYLEERKGVITLPLRFKNHSIYNRLSFNQFVLPGTTYSLGEWMMSGLLMGLNTNLSTYGLFIGKVKPFIYSNLSLSFRLPSELTIIPQAQFGYSDKKFISTKARLEKRLLKHGFLTLSYEHNFRNNMKIGELGFRYDFKFAQTGFITRQMNKVTSFIQYYSCSLINDPGTGYLGTDNRTNVGRGGITVIPYIDINNNNKFDKGEPKAYGLKLHATGGRVLVSEKDTTIRITGLEPYADCFIELDKGSFDNIAWRLNKLTYNVAVDPNMLKHLEIPVGVVGEASGTVTFEKDKSVSGISRVIVNFISEKQKQTGSILTEQDGYFSYLGLAPGSYTVRIDSAQLRKLGMIAYPDSISFKVTANLDGDYIDGLDFTLRTKPGDSAAVESVITEKSVIKKDTAYMVVHEVVEELVTITEDSWAIQLGAFKVRSNAERYRRTLEKLLGKTVNVVIEGDFWKVRIPDLKTREEVDKDLEILRQNKVTEVWVIKLKAKQQQLILTEKQDTVITITETTDTETDTTFNLAASIEAGVFTSRDEALALKDNLYKSIQKPVLIIRDEGLYKVRITGFRSYMEMLDFIPSLKKYGIKEIFIPPLSKSETGKRITVEAVEDTEPQIIRDETVKPPEVEEVIPVKEPEIALQVGIYHKKRQALKAQRKISSKLKVPVDIVPQFDYYHVIVTGFYTREETYRFYPELAAIGYPRVTILENYKKKK